MERRTRIIRGRESGRVILLQGSQMTREMMHSGALREFEYSYCKDCKTIRYASELEVTSRGLQCLICRSYDLELPRWVDCPHRKAAVKCVFGGTGLARGKVGYECRDRCKFL